MRAFLTAVGVLALAASASAATLKVPQQYGTIQEAVDAAAAGDTIVVSKGVYYESVYVGKNDITLSGKKAVIDGTFLALPGVVGVAIISPVPTPHDCLFIEGSGVTVQGFTFRNGVNQVAVYGNGARILKCVFRTSLSNGVYVGGYDGTVVSGCRILGGSGSGIFVNGSSGQGAIVEKCQIRQVQGYGIYVGGSSAAVIQGNTLGTGMFSGGIFVTASGSTVSGNRVTGVYGSGISMYGSGAQVLGNVVARGGPSTGISVSSQAGLVDGNSVSGTGSGLYADGNGIVVTGNSAAGILFGFGIYAGGDGITVSGNSIANVGGGQPGFYVYNYSSAGGGVFEDNRADDVQGDGMYFGGVTDMTISRSSVNRSGVNLGNSGIYFNGSSCTLDGLSVTECFGNGIRITGNDNTIRSSTVKGAFVNGFLVFGFGNTFAACLASNGDGQGFNNGGIGTAMDGGVFLGNRLDIANQSGASFSGGLGSVLYDTGGETTRPVVNFDN